MAIKPKDVLDMLKATVAEWIGDNATSLAAALAYYTVFSIAPLLIILIAVLELFWRGQSTTAQEEILYQVGNLVGTEGERAIEGILRRMQASESSGGVAAVVGIGTLLFGATAAFAQLQNSLNKIWEVEPAGGIKNLVLARVLSFGLILTVGFLLLVSLVVTALLATLNTFVTDLAPGLEVLFQLLNQVVAFGIVTLLFALIYRYLPDARTAWKDVFVGGAITALLFTIGKYLIGLYLAESSAASAYGAAGSFVILLLWIYYSSMVLFFGAEFTQVYARRYGQGIRPAKGAVRTEQGAAEDAEAGRTSEGGGATSAGAGRTSEEASRTSGQVEGTSEAPRRTSGEVGRTSAVAYPPMPARTSGPTSKLRWVAPAVLAFLAGRFLSR